MLTAGWHMPGLKIMDVDVKIISINIANYIDTLYIATNINIGKNQPSLIQKFSQRQFQSIFSNFKWAYPKTFYWSMLHLLNVLHTLYS